MKDYEFKENVSVLGAGKMGLGIAQLFATKGYNVKVIYVYDDKTRYDARAVVEDNLRVLAANDALMRLRSLKFWDVSVL